MNTQSILSNLRHKKVISPEVYNILKDFPPDRLYRLLTIVFIDLILLTREDALYLREAIHDTKLYEKRLREIASQKSANSVEAAISVLFWAVARVTQTLFRYSQYTRRPQQVGQYIKQIASVLKPVLLMIKEGRIDEELEKILRAYLPAGFFSERE